MIEKLNLSQGEYMLLEHIGLQQCKKYVDAKRCLLTVKFIEIIAWEEYEKAENLEIEMQKMIEKDFPFYTSIGSRFTTLFEIKNTLSCFVSHYTTEYYILQGHPEPYFISCVKKGEFPCVVSTYSELEKHLNISLKTIKGIIEQLENRELLKKRRVSFGPFAYEINNKEILNHFLNEVSWAYKPMTYNPWEMKHKEEMYNCESFAKFINKTVFELEELYPL